MPPPFSQAALPHPTPPLTQDEARVDKPVVAGSMPRHAAGAQLVVRDGVLGGGLVAREPEQALGKHHAGVRPG